MRRLIVLATLATTLIGARSADADCDDPFADPDDVLDFHLRMPRASWDALRFADLVGDGCDAQYPYEQVEFRCGDSEPWIPIGARHKRGDQRGLDTDQKPPLKLDFNRITAGQRWPAARGELGFRKLSLNNGQPDNPGGTATALGTEHFAWRLIKREVPVSSATAYVRLWAHVLDAGGGEAVEYHGLYILIEDIDRTALRARFGDAHDQGLLVKTTTGSCRDQVELDDGGINAATESMAAWLALDPAGAYDGGWLGETGRHMAIDDLLRQEAVREVLGNNRDTPLGPHYSNYVAFDPIDGIRHYLPWDLDDCFGPVPQEVDPLLGLVDCSSLGDRTRCDERIRPRYLAIACQLIQGTLAQERLVAEWLALDALVRPIVANEVAPVWEDAGRDPLDEATYGTYASEVSRIQGWIETRIPHVRAQLEAEGVSCPENCAEGASEPCERLACAGERRCEAGRWTTCEVVATEVCDNLTDDDCDGQIDEDCEVGDDVPGPDGAGGCGCRSGDDGGLLLLLLWGVTSGQISRRNRPRSGVRGTVSCLGFRGVRGERERSLAATASASPR
jgi:MYXO-CTERM domain-containing protein